MSDLFDATATGVYAEACRVTGGDRAAADDLLEAVYLAAADAVAAGAAPDAIDLGWLVAAVTALGHPPATAGHEPATQHWLDDHTRDRVHRAVRAHRPPIPPPQPVTTARPVLGRHASLIGLALAAALVAGVVAARSGGADPGGRSATMPVSAGYTIDALPAGFRPTAAAGHRPPAGSAWFQLWAAPGSTRGSGRWLAVTSVASDGSRWPLTPGGTALRLDGLAAYRRVTTDGIVELTVRLADGGSFSVMGVGFDDDAMRHVATGMVVHDGRLGYAQAATMIDDGLELVESAPSPHGLIAGQAHAGNVTSTHFQNADLSRRITLSARPSQPDDLLLASLLLPSARLVDGRVVSSEQRSDGKTTNTVQWHDGTTTLTMAGTAGLDDMLGAVESVRPANIQEWAELESLPPSYFPG